MSQPTLEAFTGTGSGRRISFEEVDQQYRLKIRSFITLCMPHIFKGLEAELALNDMRDSGIVPIMFYLVFETTPHHLAFKGEIETRHNVRLCRDVQPNPRDPAGGNVERMLLDMNIDIMAQTAPYDPHALGSATPHEGLTRAGHMRGVHVLTKPTAPAGERGVTDVPPQLAPLKVHPWDEPFPAVEGMRGVPEGFRQHDSGPWGIQHTVWGINNTDINQHVNVHEYIINIENHFARMLHGARMDVPRHRVERMEILFRKPSFMGDTCAIQGDLFTKGDETLLLGGFHALGPDGAVDPKPTVFARLQGRLADDLPVH